MEQIPQYERVTAKRSANAQVETRPAYRIVEDNRRRRAETVRFGSRLATSLLLVELSVARTIDDFDIDWFEGELLRRLRDRFFEDSALTADERGIFDLWAGMYDYHDADRECVRRMGRRRYQALLAEILASICSDEGASGEITARVLRSLRIVRG